MRFYIAARFVRAEFVRSVYASLEGRGHSITVKWTDQESLKPYEDNREKVGRYVVDDIAGVRSADVFILISEVSSDARGMYIELGCAIVAAEQTGSPRIYVVVEDGSYSAFYFHPSITCVSSLEEIPECNTYAPV